MRSSWTAIYWSLKIFSGSASPLHVERSPDGYRERRVAVRLRSSATSVSVLFLCLHHIYNQAGPREISCPVSWFILRSEERRVGNLRMARDGAAQQSKIGCSSAWTVNNARQ